MRKRKKEIQIESEKKMYQSGFLMLRNRLLKLSKEKKKLCEDVGGSQTQWKVRIMDRNQGLGIRNLSKVCEVAIGRTQGYLGCYWADE